MRIQNYVIILVFIFNQVYCLASDPQSKPKELGIKDLDCSPPQDYTPACQGDYITKSGWVAIVALGNDAYFKKYKDTKNIKEACKREPRLSFYSNAELKGFPVIEIKDNGGYINGELFSKMLLSACIEYLTPIRSKTGVWITKTEKQSYEEAFKHLIHSSEIAERDIYGIVYFEWIKGDVVKWNKFDENSPDLYFSLSQATKGYKKVRQLYEYTEILGKETEPKMHYVYEIRYPDHEWHEHYRKDDPSYAKFYDELRECIDKDDLDCLEKKHTNDVTESYGISSALNRFLLEERKYPGTYPNLLTDFPKPPERHIPDKTRKKLNSKGELPYHNELHYNGYYETSFTIERGNPYFKKYYSYLLDKLKYCFRPQLTNFKMEYTNSDMRVSVNAYFKNAPDTRLASVSCMFTKKDEQSPWLLNHFNYSYW